MIARSQAVVMFADPRLPPLLIIYEQTPSKEIKAQHNVLFGSDNWHWQLRALP